MKLICFDFDGTILRGSAWEVMIRLGGLEEEARPLLEDYWHKFQRGEEVWDCRVVRQLARKFQGIHVQEALEAVRALGLNPGVEETVRELRRRGYTLAIVSDGYRFAIDPFHDALGFDLHFSNDLEAVDGRFTGRVRAPYYRGEEPRPGCLHHCLCKRRVLELLRKRLKVAREDVVAIGDSLSDLCMVQEAGLGVAFRAREVLERVADLVIREDLRELLEDPRVAVPSPSR